MIGQTISSDSKESMVARLRRERRSQEANCHSSCDAKGKYKFCCLSSVYWSSLNLSMKDHPPGNASLHPSYASELPRKFWTTHLDIWHGICTIWVRIIWVMMWRRRAEICMVLNHRGRGLVNRWQVIDGSFDARGSGELIERMWMLFLPVMAWPHWLHQEKPTVPFITIDHYRLLYITICDLCCNKCNNSIMASIALPPYL